MLLTLEVISPNGEALGANRRKTIGPEGAQIGRAKGNDWVIADPYISRVNVRIRCVNGAFYVEGVGRNPLALNDAANIIANNEPQLLRNGDRIILDEYEIRATVASPRTSEAAHEDPFSVDVPAAQQVPDVWSSGPVSGQLDIRDGQTTKNGNLDPIAVLGGMPRAHVPPKHIEFDQRSVLDDSLQLQPITSDGHPDPDHIPDTWDRSRLTKIEAPPPVKKPAGPPIKSPRRGVTPVVGIPDAWERSNVQFEERAPARPVPAPPAAPPNRRPVAPPVVRPTEPLGRTEVLRSGPASQPPSLPIETASSTNLSLEQLLRAANVPANHMTPEMAAELGQVLRIVVQGVMEVLQSRAEIKSQLRMSMTRIQPTENNPLKFSPNVEAALHTLLVEHNQGYLPAARAFEEALIDIRDHQIAVLQGIRVAFDAMLETFDPERIEEEIDGGAKRGGLLNLGGKSRFRDHYVAQYEKLLRDRDESFRRLFGEPFAQAYEEQMDRLKAAARTSGR